MQLVVWALVVLSVLYSQGTNACPDQCSCVRMYSCDGTYVDCNSRGLTGVPTDIPTDTCYLDLRFNQITTLPNGIFDPLTSLETLYLSSNKITTLPNEIFDALTSLQRLNLGGNAMTTLPNGIFDALTSLQTLYLYDNEIPTLLTGTFDALTSLQTLDLGDNKLTTLQTGTFDQLVNLLELYVNGNPLHCECQVVAFIRFIKTRQLQLKPYWWSTEPSCQNPLNLKETLLKDISLQEVACDSESTTVTTDIDTTVFDSTTVTTAIDTTVLDFRSASTEVDTAVTEIAGVGDASVTVRSTTVQICRNQP